MLTTRFFRNSLLRQLNHGICNLIYTGMNLIIITCSVSDDVIVAHVARYALDTEGQPLKPSLETTGVFSEMALYVLVRSDSVWRLAAAQNNASIKLC